MSVDLRKIINELRSLVETLKLRCSIAEKRLLEKENEIETLNLQLEAEKAQTKLLAEKYESLKMGTATAQAGDISELKDKYLALVREIDDCIRLMQHGR